MKSRLVVFQGSVDAERYISEALEPELVPFTLEEPYLIFQQDNAHAHTARLTTNFLDNQPFQRLPWPARSPDLNIIEQMWNTLGRRLGTAYDQLPTSTVQLAARLTEQWDAISQVDIQRLYDSMPNRIQMCINNNGSHTRY